MHLVVNKIKSESKVNRNLLITVLLNIFISIAELIGGILSNSLALISDAIHNFSDGLAIAITYASQKISNKQSNQSNTFGYKRIQILSALFNAVTLIAICIFLLFEAYQRFLNPEPVQSVPMFIVASIGLIANIIGVFLLKDKGIIINEPSVVAVNNKTGQILAIGEEAKKMVGKTPSYITATRPLVNGVISDFEVTEQMLKYFIEKASASSKKLFGIGGFSRVIIGIPCGVTEVERKAVRDAAKNAGARTVFLIEEPLASAIGAKLQIQEAGGNFIVDIGGGTTEVAVISLGGIVVSRSLRVAGDKLNDDIIQFAQKEYKLLIGERTAEHIKISIGSAMPSKEKKEMAMRGRNLVTGLPEEVVIFNDDVQRALERSVRQIVSAIKTTIEETPPELLADVMTDGIFLAGGGSMLKDLDVLISKETKMPCKIVDDPLTSVVRGAGIALENIETLSEVMSKDNEEEAFT